MYINTVKPVYSGHLGENDKMTTIYRWPLYGGFEFSTRYCTLVVNKHFLITCYVCLLFCSCGHVTELTLVYIYCWWSYLKVILNKPVSSIQTSSIIYQMIGVFSLLYTIYIYLPYYWWKNDLFTFPKCGHLY
jgi:hypothetical protein